MRPAGFSAATALDATRATILAAVRDAAERPAAARILAAGGPSYPHEELGAPTARAWILFSGVHLAARLHRVAAVMRARSARTLDR